MPMYLAGQLFRRKPAAVEAHRFDRTPEGQESLRPMLVLPDDVPGHPLQTSIEVASLAPNAQITVFPWKEPEELKQRTIDRVRHFLKAHVPMRAAAQ